LAIERGQSLLHYRLIEKIGEGGMGVVWRATDTSLGREVAIKFLPDVVAQDPERLARFEHEARVLASLNHPNIASIYGLHREQELIFLSMELVEGENLQQRLSHGALSVEEALDVGRQVARALEAAHDNGVIHRDLKPANVQIDAEGRVKVLDFGLAKVFHPDPASSSSNLTRSPTITSLGTVAGVILGTAAYMSPEQARGKALDKRSDNWSFGCVLFECLTGKLTFGGETVSDTVAKILERDPDWNALPERTPAPVRQLLRRCLAKAVARRLRDIGDARLELEDTIAGRSWTEIDAPAAEDKTGASRPRSAWLIVAAALVLGVALGALGWRAIAPGGFPPSVTASKSVSITIPPELELLDWKLTADGQTVVIVAETEGPEEARFRRRAYRRLLDSFEFTPIDGTKGIDEFAISPNGRWLVGYFTHETRAELRKIAIEGGPAVTIWEGVSRPFCPWEWVDDRTLLFVSDPPAELSLLSADGGESRVVSRPDQTASPGNIGWFSVLPDGSGALVTSYHEGGEGFTGQIEYLSLETGERTLLIEDGAWARYASTGHIVFSRRDTLLAAPFDPSEGRVTGGIVPVHSGLSMWASWADAGFELSRDGTLLYIPGGNAAAERRLVIVDRAGNVEPLSETERDFDGMLEVTPDGKRVSVVMAGENRSWQAWVYDVDRDTLRRVPMPGADVYYPVWAPDGQRMIFTAVSSNKPQRLCIADLRRHDPPEVVYTAPAVDFKIYAGSWSPDGSVVAVDIDPGDGRTQAHILPLDGSEPTPLFEASRAKIFSPRFSPDGRWIAYLSDETDRAELYVTRYPVADSGWMVSTDGARQPFWSRGGRELFWMDPRDRMMAAELRFDSGVSSSEPHALFDIDELRLLPGLRLAPEGRRFLAIQQSKQERETPSLNLVLTWLNDLERITSRSN